VPVLSKFYHAHLPLQTCRAIPTLTDLTTLVSPNRSSPAFPFNYGPCHVQSLPLQSATRLTCRAPTLRVILPELSPDFPCLPDLYSPVLIFPLTALTHLACWASRNPDVTHPSMPAMPHPPVPVNRHRIAPLPPARTFLSASLVACHHKPCPTQTLPVNLHSPFRACYSLPIRPFQTRPFHTLSCLTC